MLNSLFFCTNEQLIKVVNNGPPLQVGSTGSGVKCLQIALACLGQQLPRSIKIGTFEADGIFGQETRQAVINFQRQQPLQADGIAGRQTISRLDNILNVGDKDPLLKAVTDCRQYGAQLIRACQKGPAVSEHREFQSRIQDINQLLLGDPIRLGIKIQKAVRLMPYRPTGGGIA